MAPPVGRVPSRSRRRRRPRGGTPARTGRGAGGSSCRGEGVVPAHPRAGLRLCRYNKTPQPVTMLPMETKDPKGSDFRDASNSTRIPTTIITMDINAYQPIAMQIRMKSTNFKNPINKLPQYNRPSWHGGLVSLTSNRHPGKFTVGVYIKRGIVSFTGTPENPAPPVAPYAGDRGARGGTHESTGIPISGIIVAAYRCIVSYKP